MVSVSVVLVLVMSVSVVLVSVVQYQWVLVSAGAHELPEGRQGASNYVQRHLILSGFDTFLIWTYPQVGNLSLWFSLCGSARTCETSATYCVSTRTERVLLFRVRDANSRIVN